MYIWLVSSWYKVVSQTARETPVIGGDSVRGVVYPLYSEQYGISYAIQN